MAVRIFEDGREYWEEVAKGFVRIRAIALTFVGTIVLTALTSTGAPWWYGWINSGSSGTVSTSNLVAMSAILSVFFLGCLVTVGLIYLRKRTIRSLNVKYLMHQVAHKGRDWDIALKQDPNATTSLKEVLGDLSGAIQQLFQALIPNKDIQVVFRIVVFEGGKQSYKTVYRTSGLNSNRDATTQSIPIDTGLPKYLRDKSGHKGVIICYDTDEAVRFNILTNTDNHQKYGSEIKTFMAVGLNSWDGQKKDMIGILFITSSNKNVFHSKHIDLVAAVADIVAVAVSNKILSNATGEV